MSSNYCDECGRVEGDPGEVCPECGSDTIRCDEPCDPALGCDLCADYWSRMRDQGYWKDGAGWTAAAFKEWAKP